jgi:hypothetical protein
MKRSNNDRSSLLTTYRAVLIGSAGEEVVLGDANIASSCGDIVVLLRASERSDFAQARKVRVRRGRSARLESRSLEGSSARGKEEECAGDLHVSIRCCVCGRLETVKL